jgi:hypothetical protein
MNMVRIEILIHLKKKMEMLIVMIGKDKKDKKRIQKINNVEF